MLKRIHHNTEPANKPKPKPRHANHGSAKGKCSTPLSVPVTVSLDGFSSVVHPLSFPPSQSTAGSMGSERKAPHPNIKRQDKRTPERGAMGAKESVLCRAETVEEAMKMKLRRRRKKKNRKPPLIRLPRNLT
ncbi:Intraflagellar transport protein 88-like protein [Anopheles sinensis]|uniref:Intraflagellar transport protein 88-like protein n=1 Tax=Anopheles sinensis TaxID=74873 RepID=A0A084WCH0_ANOSI|nr:Intraflagellar transport protein 88-like protein [Anopheles sinensis]